MPRLNAAVAAQHEQVFREPGKIGNLGVQFTDAKNLKIAWEILKSIACGTAYVNLIW